MSYFYSMDEPFFLPVVFKGIEHQFEASLKRRGYVAVLEINVHDALVIFERDEQGDWRAILPEDQAGKTPDVALLRAIGEAIEQILQ
jgi:hypothetical protein